jgi:hypothetical protein
MLSSAECSLTEEVFWTSFSSRHSTKQGSFQYSSVGCHGNPHRLDHSSCNLQDQEELSHEYAQFEVADFEIAYNTFLGRHTLTKFMVIPRYAYLVMKMSDPSGVISINVDVKQAYNYDRESCGMKDGLLASIEVQNLKKAMVESPLDPIMPEAKTSNLSI